MYRGSVLLREKLTRLTRPIAPDSARSDVIEDLRRRIEQTLRRSIQVPQGPRPVDTVDLPFLTHETPLGPLHSRERWFSGSHRVGRLNLDEGLEANAEVLALLALDPTIGGCSPRGALFIDTETTGLAGGTGTIAFLVGIAWWRPDGRLALEQLLIRRLGEEAPMLDRLRERIEKASMLVTFNGKSFDLPLLRTRFVMAGRRAPNEPPHLDLLHVARRVHGSRMATGCRLAALERTVLAFERGDDVASADIAALYHHFLRTGEARALLGVVEHNAWDVVTMAALIGLYGGVDRRWLEPSDLVAVARTYRRAGALEHAANAAEEAVAREPSIESLRARADISKARGDRSSALADYRTLAQSHDDPRVRLELAKLYEHWAKAPGDALGWARRGTGERADAAARRVERLTKKVDLSLRKERRGRAAPASLRRGSDGRLRDGHSGSNEEADPEDPAAGARLARRT
jgi:hypothetical protein